MSQRSCSNESSGPVSARRRPRASVRFWRLFGLLAALLLASTYFMPAINCRDWDGPKINPSQEMRGYISGASGYFAWAGFKKGLAEYLAEFVMYVAPYLFAALVALGAVARLLERTRPQRALAWAMLSIYLFTGAAVIACSSVGVTWEDIEIFSFGDDMACSCLFVPIGAMAYACWVMRYREHALYYLTFIACLLCIVRWFRWSFFSMAEPTYGLGWAWVATIGLLIATIAEYACHFRLNPALTFCVLISGGPFRMLPGKAWRGRCPECGYCLYGVASERCPECGRPFRQDEVGMSLSELQTAARRLTSNTDRKA